MSILLSVLGLIEMLATPALATYSQNEIARGIIAGIELENGALPPASPSPVPSLCKAI